MFKNQQDEDVIELSENLIRWTKRKGKVKKEEMAAGLWMFRWSFNS